MRRGEIWWTSLADPAGSGPGFRRPVLVMQSNDFNESSIGTTIGVALTSNLRLAQAPGNCRLRPKDSGLRRDSVVNVSQLITVDKRLLTSLVARVSAGTLRNVEAGIRLVLAL